MRDDSVFTHLDVFSTKFYMHVPWLKFRYVTFWLIQINLQADHYQLNFRYVEAYFLFCFFQSITKCKLLNVITVVNQTLEGYTLRFLKNIFRPKYIDLVRSVQSCSVYRYVATSAKHFSVANTSMDSVVNVTLNLARRSNTFLNRIIWY